MPQEQQLKDRWLDDFHGSSEFQNAQRRDSIAKFQREAQVRQAIQTALRGGNSRKASQIQQGLLDENTQEGIGAAGEVAVQNNYQNERANDYIAQAESRGRQQAATLRQQPLSGLTQSGNYLFGLENPDFSTYTPNADTSRLHYGDGIKRDSRGVSAPVVGKPAVATDTTGVARQAALDAANQHNAQAKHERAFKASLPPELSKVYDTYTASLTPREQVDFLSQSPEMRYGKLRGSLPRSATPQALGADRMVMNGQGYNATRNGPAPIGSIGSGDLTFSSPTLPTVKPVTNVRPTAQLGQPTDYLEARAFGF